jgi:DNA-binding Xre family transcriptional regulator
MMDIAMIILKGCDYMYMDYSKLWKILIDKNMTKTELMDETGLSSRIIAKLSKNEIVTTETLLRICDCLNCDVADIMECKEGKSLSLYKYYINFGKIINETENYKLVKFEYNGQKYVIYKVKKSILNSTIIHLEDDGTIYREQLYPFGGVVGPSSVKSTLLKPIKEKYETVIVLFSGKPNFRKLDDGIFVSPKNKNINLASIYVMTEAYFKLFEPLQK